MALDGCWHRIERNLAADVAAAWSGATLTGVRGMVFHAYSASSAMWVDDVRFSNAMTVERNSLLPGAVGHITCRRAVDTLNFGHTDTFYFYDHIGNVQGVSSAGGSVAESYVQDAWGNVLATPTTGQWVTSFGGRHYTGLPYDDDIGLYKTIRFWYSSNLGRKTQPGSPYAAAKNNPASNQTDYGFPHNPANLPSACNGNDMQWVPGKPKTCHDCVAKGDLDPWGKVDKSYEGPTHICTAKCSASPGNEPDHSWLRFPDGTGAHCLQNTSKNNRGYCMMRNLDPQLIAKWVEDNCRAQGGTVVWSSDSCKP